MWYIYFMNKDIINLDAEDDITDVISQIKKSTKKVVAVTEAPDSELLRSAVNMKLIAKTAATLKKSVVVVTTDPIVKRLAAVNQLPIAESLKARPTMPSVNEPAPVKPAKSVADEVFQPEAAEPVAAPLTDDEKIAAAMAESADFDDDGTESNISLDSVDAPEEATGEMLGAAGDSRRRPAGKSRRSAEDSDDEDDWSDAEDDWSDAADDKPSRKSAKDDEWAGTADDSEAPEDDESAAVANPAKKTKKPKKAATTPVGQWFEAHKIPVIAGSVVAVLAIAVVVVLNVFNNVKITVTLKTSSENFSEALSFTETQSAEDAESGLFYLETIEKEHTQETTFTASGKKDLGAKASGTLELTDIQLATMKQIAADGGASYTIAAGTKFTYNDLTFVTTKAVTLAVEKTAECDNAATMENASDKCLVSTTIAVEASENGENYNIAAGKKDWTCGSHQWTITNNEISGGSSEIVTIVTEEDVEKAKSSLADAYGSSALKKDVLGAVASDMLAIESSYAEAETTYELSVEIGEEVSDKNGEVTLKKTQSGSVKALDETKLKEFIRTKAKVADDQKIYDLGNLYVESFLETTNGYQGKLKTTFKVGPNLTAKDVLDKTQGKKLGEVQTILKSINGVSSVSFTKNFWVMSVPNDANKIEIEILSADGTVLTDDENSSATACSDDDSNASSSNANCSDADSDADSDSANSSDANSTSSDANAGDASGEEKAED